MPSRKDCLKARAAININKYPFSSLSLCLTRCWLRYTMLLLVEEPLAIICCGWRSSEEPERTGINAPHELKKNIHQYHQVRSSQSSPLFLCTDWSLEREEHLRSHAEAFFHTFSQDIFITFNMRYTISISIHHVRLETQIHLPQMHTLMPISVHVCTHSTHQYTPTPSQRKDKTSRSLTYTVTEYQSYSEASLFASPRMFLSPSIKGL